MSNASSGVNRIRFLERRLGSGANVHERITRLYLPIYEWCLERVGKAGPVFIGINGPQGAGKSTLTRTLCELFEHEGLRAVTVSVDDFYLTHEEQRRLAIESSENPYLQSRGYPGTHDVELGTQVLRELKGQDGTVLIPQYDKSQFAGKGDRLPRDLWRKVELPLEIVFFEGWMLGFRAREESVFTDPHLVDINRRLRAYEQWWAQLDALIQLKPKDYRFVIDWRVEAEERMKASGKPGLSEAEIRAYVTTFLPAYELYLPELAAPAIEELVVEIDLDRLPK